VPGLGLVRIEFRPGIDYRRRFVLRNSRKLRLRPAPAEEHDAVGEAELVTEPDLEGSL